jgi:broad specificity phosphatase PhoE
MDYSLKTGIHLRTLIPQSNKVILVCSPFTRCLQTASAIISGLKNKIAINIHEQLSEVHQGKEENCIDMNQLQINKLGIP